MSGVSRSITRPSAPRSPPPPGSRPRRRAARGSWPRTRASRRTADAAVLLDRARPGVVAGQCQRHLAAELLEQIAHQVGLGVDRGHRIERVAQSVGVGRARHELCDALRPGRAARERVEARLCVQLSRQHVHGHVPAQGRTRDRIVESGRHEARQPVVDAPVVAPGQLPRALVVARRVLLVARVGPVAVVPGLPGALRLSVLGLALPAIRVPVAA